ncbi:hypothetical protein GGE67_002182 [Rhizobium leucaenae]|nr:hypothetical protein [Rhizobium leucaenae]MBB6301573.1 hypothetical protein [Rhizobium leucaenae]
MTEVNEAMFSEEPCALSMRITVSVEAVWQPDRPIAVRRAKAGTAAARFETKKDSFEERNCLDVVIAIIGFAFPMRYIRLF